ncbi:MAG: DUF1569 domain-containing protein [Bacteroidetes bacterium]|nr:DUF1569 domain-containing protein [Bacteroidota bacterium]
MKTVLDKTTREELINRINSLNENSKAQWGKMNIHQMLMHCTLWEEMAFGQRKYKQVFIGKVFGKLALKKILKDDAPLTRSTPTTPDMIIKESNVDISKEKNKWITLIGNYEKFSNPDFIHPFFGKMTEEQIGLLAYKHTDHHLRQFKA